MIQECLKIFKEICSIPHPSRKTEALREWIIAFGQKYQCQITQDQAGNILLKKGMPQFCLQAHYDMVLVGDEVEPLEEGNFLRSKNSSLGADNGIGVALALVLLMQEEHLECLFTNDEEIGLLGALGLEIPIESKFLLNLDSEFFGGITVSCAGGYVLHNSFLLQRDDRKYQYHYQITSKGYRGGHSGLDIAQNPHNPIKDVFLLLKGLDYGISTFKAGEFSNSIPITLQMQIQSNAILQSCDQFEITPIEPLAFCYEKSSLENYILEMQIGVLAHQDTKILNSLNLAQVLQEEGCLNIILMGRANTKAFLEQNIQNSLKLAKKYGGIPLLKEQYPPWEERPQGRFLEIVKEAFGYRASITESMHAGLECGILQEKLGDDVEILSLGPTIFFPHSRREKLDIATLKELVGIVAKIVRTPC